MESEENGAFKSASVGLGIMDSAATPFPLEGVTGANVERAEQNLKKVGLMV